VPNWLLWLALGLLAWCVLAVVVALVLARSVGDSGHQLSLSARTARWRSLL